MATQSTTSPLANVVFAKVGQYGIEAAVTEKYVYLRIPGDKALARTPGEGKTYHMQGTSGGFVSVPGSDLRVSVNAGFKPEDMPAPAPKAELIKGPRKGK